MTVERNTIGLIFLSLMAFAGNSVLCRLALLDKLIDPASFTSIRLLSGALFLFIVLRPKLSLAMPVCRNMLPATCLFVYAAFFSFAYVNLGTGTGALILFGAVQLVMLLISIFSGQRPSLAELVGMFLAVLGLLWLLLPGSQAPHVSDFVLMAVAGIAWGYYSFLGRGVEAPAMLTANNFILCVPVALVLLAVNISNVSMSPYGLILAIVSGALTSGLGYVLWYTVLDKITIVQSAVLQLLVPILATIGGLIFVGESLSLQLLISSMLVLGGVLLSILGKSS